MRAVLAALLLAAAAPAWDDTPERAALLVDTIRGNDCAMTGDEADAVLPGTGLSVEEVDIAISVLYPAGLVSLSENGEALVLSEGLCAAEGDQSLTLITEAFDTAPVIEHWSPDITPAEAATLIGALRDNECVMTEDAAAEQLPALGLDMAATRDSVAVLLEAGVVMLSEDGGTLHLGAQTCAADAAGDIALANQALADYAAQTTVMPGAQPMDVLTGPHGLDGVRSLTEVYAEMSGCTIALEDRTAAETAITDFVAEQMTLIFGFDPDWSDDARTELTWLVAAVLDAPGPELSRAGDTLTLTNCTP